MSCKSRCTRDIGSTAVGLHTRCNLADVSDANAIQIGQGAVSLRAADKTGWDAGFRGSGGARGGRLPVGNTGDRQDSSESLGDHLETLEMHKSIRKKSLKGSEFLVRFKQRGESVWESMFNSPTPIL